MNDAGLWNSPSPARPYDVTDEQLSAELKKWSGTTPALQPVGELLDRHWEAAFAYARLCTDGPRPAGMLTTAAFTRLFGESLRQTGPTAAWRPHLLVTVRRIAAEWDSDGRREMLHPALRTEAGGERAAARLLPPTERRLLSGAFQRVQQSARCLLWHTEVEAEPLGVPAALLGLDEEDAGVELRRARERLREECLQVHRELAPEQECRHYLRLLDVTYRRGGVDLDPDLREHLERCRHCMHTADQLHQFNGRLGLALAEAVLGWGAAAYVDARMSAAEGGAPDEAEDHAMARPFVGEAFGIPLWSGAPAEGATASGLAVPGPRSRARSASRRSAHKAARRTSRRNLTAAVLTVSGLIVLPLVMWSSFGPSDGDTSADAGPSEIPGTDTASASSDPSWAGAGEARKGDLSGRLHNVDSGLCVGVGGHKLTQGAEAELAQCSASPDQQWTYETDGLLRSAADPDLCLDSHLGFSVRLATCTGATTPDAKSVRYDFTLQGTLVPRWDQDLALTPAATDGSGALVLKTRDEGSAQRWVFDTSKTDVQMQAVNWDAESSSTPTPKSAPAPSSTSTATPKASATPSTPQATPTPTSSATTNAPCYPNPYYCNGGGNPYGGGYGYGGPYGGGYGYGGPYGGNR
ncbi:RICIN domain-containing protein [Streptomyces sp. NBC_00285]|uniref:RICIN domain-containing protein n=1 Tax=Streptomyces sp. NBC_00285 TaxID=2975700 RepID=UPI002E2B7E3C|nr:RICIN domain-containing protein [Streptomyces sp. NBC_00285]